MTPSTGLSMQSHSQRSQSRVFCVELGRSVEQPDKRRRMADVFTPAKRSDVMSRIRSSGTKPEKLVYTILRDILGYRWRIDRNRADLPGKPDFVVPTLWLIVFVDGCFFHQCSKHGRIPDSNRAYWEPKLRRNVRRDASNRRKLRSAGYTVVRIWEHDTKTHAATERSLRRLDRIVQKRKATILPSEGGTELPKRSS